MAEKTTTYPSKVEKKEIRMNGEEKKPRLEVLKTYKIYIGGKFPRTESGRYYTPKNKAGKPLGNICLSSRKDLRDSVAAARKALPGWAGKSAFNRSQILYRMGEILEGRKAQFVEELMLQGASKTAAEKEVFTSIDRLIHYAGWCDKFQQVFSSVNPVASSHFNFSLPEPTGVVGILAPEESGLLGLISALAPVIAGGNTCVVLASEKKPLCAISFSEVLNSSDVPGGVINILTGKSGELYAHFSTHMDINALICCLDNRKMIKNIQENAAGNVKRAIIRSNINWESEAAQSPYWIMDTQEIKTTWHPIENIGAGSEGY